MNYNSNNKKLHHLIKKYYGNLSEEYYLSNSKKFLELIENDKELVYKKNSISETISLFNSD